MKKLYYKKLFLLLLCGTLSNAMCWGGKKTKHVKSTQTTMELSKTTLIDLIQTSNLEGIKKFTASGGAGFIDVEACNLAKTKFEATKTNNPAQFSMNNQFLVMVMVQALAPQEVKQQLGLPTSAT